MNARGITSFKASIYNDNKSPVLRHPSCLQIQLRTIWKLGERYTNFLVRTVLTTVLRLDNF